MSDITLTSKASTEAKRFLKDDQYKNLPLRLYLEGKGCDGFYYGVTFDQKTPEDLSFTSLEVDIIVDPDTFEFCKGSTIDWVDDERGKGFLVDNPNHRKFRGKFYKRQSWQNKLEEKQKS